MPAILRIFRYQMSASHTVRGSTVSYDQIQGSGGWGLDSRETCEQYEVETLDVESDPGGHEDDHDPEYDVLHVCSYRPGGW